MTERPTISRRLLLAGLWLAASSSAWAQQVRGGRGDQGIGGTGRPSVGQDQGIGGTVIVGVIQRFGSIYVNGERISYAPDVPVRIDGEPVSAKALRIGHVTRVLALRQANGTLTTRGIDAVSEVIGPIETVRTGEMVVLGQKVIWAGRESWRRPGTSVAVFGLRRTDGVIVASLVEKRRDTATRVAGLLERDRDGLRVGGLRLQGMDAALIGRRVQIEGHAAQGVMQVTRAKPDDFSDLSGANRLLIEAYVRRVGSGLQLGSGYVAHDASRFQPTTGGDMRAVVSAVFDASRGLQVESIQSVGKFPGASMEGPGAPGRGPGSPAGAPQHGPGGAGAPGGGPNSPGGGPNAPGGPGPGGMNEPGGPGGFGPPGGPGPGGGFGGGGFGGGGPRR